MSKLSLHISRFWEDLNRNSQSAKADKQRNSQSAKADKQRNSQSAKADKQRIC